MNKAKFSIQGMSCSSCSARIDREVNKLNGVKNVNVNLLSNSMTLEYDKKLISTNDIIKTVVDAGYGAILDENDNSSANYNNITNTIESMKKKIIISFIFLLVLMFVSMHQMFFNLLKIQTPTFLMNIFYGNENALTFALTQLLLLIPIIYLNRNYFITGIKRLLKLSPNMDSLIAIGSGVSILYGLFAIFRINYGLNNNDITLVEHYKTNLYFESAGIILTLISFGKFLEMKSKRKTSDAISKLINLAPKVALVERNGQEIEINTEDIVKDDIVIIKPGSTIPVDGIIIEGFSNIDESSVTGESIPVNKQVGENVISGTTNKNGFFKMKAIRVGEDTTLSQIIKLVEEASNSKAPISKLADKVSLIFVPTVILIAIVTVIAWLLSGQTFEFAIGMGISVLVISCPCALGLATPVAIMVGTGRGAENGILFKDAESLELLYKVDTIVLDKTGTITNGKPIVTDVITTIPKDELLKISSSLERKSEHPLGEAIQKASNGEYLTVNNFKTIPGRGISGEIDARNYSIGNLSFMKEQNVTIDESESSKLLNDGKTVLYVANEDKLIGMIACQDVIKDSSKLAISEMKKANLNTIMLTGDNRFVSNSIAKELEIDKVIAEILPVDKENEVSKLQMNEKKVAFVGDGINDSPALVKSDVGIAIGSGTDIAIESADVVLMKDNLLDVVTAYELSKATIKNIKMNLFWAFFYNCIGIPIAAGVFYMPFGLRLNPMIGALAMSFSSVCVVTNALRLKKFKPSFKKE